MSRKQVRSPHDVVSNDRPGRAMLLRLDYLDEVQTRFKEWAASKLEDADGMEEIVKTLG